METPGGVALQAGFNVVPTGEARFELADRLRVTIARRGPLLQDAGALVSELRQPPFGRLAMVLAFTPTQERGVEAIDLRLQIGEALFQASNLRKHVSLWGG